MARAGVILGAEAIEAMPIVSYIISIAVKITSIQIILFSQTY